MRRNCRRVWGIIGCETVFTFMSPFEKEEPVRLGIIIIQSVYRKDILSYTPLTVAGTQESPRSFRVYYCNGGTEYRGDRCDDGHEQGDT
jgi:hypothetical protein